MHNSIRLGYLVCTGSCFPEIMATRLDIWMLGMYVCQQF
jgi:hypothetical protein